jgi:hypothetical protein
MVDIIGDRAGQLVKNREYWMGRNGSGLIWNSELHGGSPRLSWLRTDRLAPVSKFELCTGTYGISWGLANWVASCVTKTEAILSYLTGAYWDTAWATHGVSIEVYAWKACTMVRWALIITLTVLWTVATCGALLCRMCRVVRFKLARVSAIPLDMSNTYPLQSFHRIINFIILWW